MNPRGLVMACGSFGRIPLTQWKTRRKEKVAGLTYLVVAVSEYFAVVMLCRIGAVKQRRVVTMSEHSSYGGSLEVIGGPLAISFNKTQWSTKPTGVRSRLSSSVAEAAASIKSSHRLPMIAAAVAGSAEKAFLS